MIFCASAGSSRWNCTPRGSMATPPEIGILLLAQQPARIIAQILHLGLQDGGRVDFEQHMRAALQIEAEHDGAQRNPARQMGLSRGARAGDNRLGAITKRASTVADKIETTFQVAKRSMGENHLFRLDADALSGGILDRLALGTNLGNQRPRDAHFDVGGDLKLELIIVDDARDFADQAAGHHDRVAAADILDHDRHACARSSAAAESPGNT